MTTNEDFRLILDYSSDLHWMIDCASARVLYTSPAAGRKFGYGPEKSQAVADMLMHDLPARIARFEAGDESRRTLRREAELEGRGGTLVPVEIESTLVHAADGSLRLVGVVRDISERREQEAQQKRFVSMISHEFRTPLSTIDGAIQRLEMTADEADEATQKRYRKIATAVERLLGMIEEYLTPERLASIGRKRQPNEISPEALLETAAEQARLRRGAVVVQNEGLPQWLRCNPQGLRMCLDILLDNAIKYSPDGTPVVLSGRRVAGGGVELTVTDYGPPIPAGELERIFEKGYRGEMAGGVPGSGLGLYMARSVVEVHGGTLSVENIPESGKKFRIWLPLPA
jgi:PAS domain S-box-containing protein